MRRKGQSPREPQTYRYDGPLRTITGEYPNGAPSGHHFGAWQGEWFVPPEPRWRGIDAQIGLLPLNNGRWLAHPKHGFAVYNEQFETREAALRCAVASVVRRFRSMSGRGGPGWKQLGCWPERAEGVITWARSLLDLPPRPLVVVKVEIAAARTPRQLLLFDDV